MQEAGQDPGAESGLLAAYLASYARLRAALLRRTGSPSAAEDLSQELYLRLAGRAAAHTEAEVANPEGYVRRMAQNIASDWRRGAARQGMPAPVSADIPSDAPSAERTLLARERLKQVLELADLLPPRCREVFVLRKLKGLEQHEIAARLGISLNMVQKHLRKALEDIAAGLAARE